MDMPIGLHPLHGHVALVFCVIRRRLDLPEGEEAVVAAATGAQEPGGAGMKLQVIDKTFVALDSGGEAMPRLAPVPDFDVSRPGQAIDVADLADAAYGQVIADP